MVNKIIIVGYVGKDPEVRHLDNNFTTTRFTLATNERWTKDGTLVEHTEWFNIVVWKSGLATIAAEHVKKGSLLYVEGKIRTRSYDDKDGNKRTITEVVADSFTFIGSKPDAAKSTTSTVVPPVETTELDAETGGDLPF